MDKIELVKKLFINIFVFVAVFLIISTTANLVYLAKDTNKAPGAAGWSEQPDFKVYLIAARNLSKRISFGLGPEKDSQRRALLNRYPVYDKTKSFYHFRYSPTIAFFMIPFGKMLYPRTALFWWSTLSIFAYLAALLLLVRQISDDFMPTNLQRYIILWGAFFATLRYFLMILDQGQTDVFIALFLVLFLMAYLRNKEIFCGVILALILQIKPFFFPVLIYFLLRGKRKLIISTIVAFAGLLFIPCFAIGWGETIALLGEWKEILSMSIPSQILNFKNQSVSSALGILLLKNGVISNAISPEKLIYPISAILTLSAYVMTLRLRRSAQTQNEKKSKYFEVSALIIISVLFSPIAWVAYFVNLLIPFAFTTLLMLRSKKRGLFYACLAFYFILSCAVGTDITKFIPGVNSFHFINISLGTMFLAFVMIHSYKQN